jgi:hypothetical protein
MKLSLQVKDMQENYQKAQEAYSMIIEWKDIHQNFLENIPVYSDKKRIRDILPLNLRMAMIKDIKNTQEKVSITSKELWKSSNNLLTQFGMDPLRYLEKASSTQTMFEDVESRRNLSMKSIEFIYKVNAEVIETGLIRPAKLIFLIEDSLQRVEHKLKTEIIIPICNSKMDLQRTQLCRVDTILEDFKMWKNFIEKMQPPRPT